MFHRAKKSLGQNFLTSPAVINKMVVAGNITENDVVLEIGPGKGALTRALLGKAKQVIAIEKDPALIEILQEKFKNELNQEKLLLISDDALEVNTQALLKSKPYKVVSNIPYYITGALLRHFLSQAHKPETVVFLMQKEVADRIMARDNKESILSLSVKAYGTADYIQKVSRKAFTPSPNVDSAIIAISNIKQCVENEELFFKLIKTGFQHKRKTLLKNLSKDFETKNIVTAFAACAIPENIRAEDVSFQQWVSMTKYLNKVYL